MQVKISDTAATGGTNFGEPNYYVGYSKVQRNFVLLEIITFLPFCFRVRSIKEQVRYLCQYMAAHPDFAAGEYKTPQGAAAAPLFGVGQILGLDRFVDPTVSGIGRIRGFGRPVAAR